MSARITVFENVTWQRTGSQPQTVPTRFVKHLECDRRPFVAEFDIGEAWQALDFGPVERPAVVVLANIAGYNATRIPTAQEAALKAGKVLEIGAQDAICTWLIPPGESFRGNPSSRAVYVRCKQGTCRAMLTVYPE